MTPAPIKPLISSDDLDKIDIRVGTITAVEDVPNSEKLVRLRVDFGDHMRSILVGMKNERQNARAEIEGKQALFVVNLEPRRMAGELSEGMLFDIGYADKISPVLALIPPFSPKGRRSRSGQVETQNSFNDLTVAPRSLAVRCGQSLARST